MDLSDLSNPQIISERVLEYYRPIIYDAGDDILYCRKVRFLAAKPENAFGGI